MKKLILMALLSMTIDANTQPFKKDILLNNINKPTLVKVKLENDVYQKSANHYQDLRVKNRSKTVGYFIETPRVQNITNQKTLTATSYNREKATLVYEFSKSFEVESIKLNIEDRNFESSIDVYANNKLVVKNKKIFDYSNETGIRDFTIHIAKQKVKKLTLVYHLDETTAFYKKYRNIHQRTKYLTIKSIRVSNHNRAKEHFDVTSIELKESHTNQDKKESSYLFKTNGIPFSKIAIETEEQNFKRTGKIYLSNNAKEWHYADNFSISASSLSSQNNPFIYTSQRANYVKIVLFNADNNPLTLKRISLFTKPNYLYFIANPNEEYSLYFGDKNATKANYELKSLLGEKRDATEASLGELKELEVEKTSQQVSFFEYHKEQLFIFAMLLALAILGYVAFGLLKRVP